MEHTPHPKMMIGPGDRKLLMGLRRVKRFPKHTDCVGKRQMPELNRFSVRQWKCEGNGGRGGAKKFLCCPRNLQFSSEAASGVSPAAETQPWGFLLFF